MLRVLMLRASLALLCAAIALAAGDYVPVRPVPVIFDTDLGPDCDDAGALAVLNAFVDTGEAILLGTMCSTTSEWCAPAINAINTWYGRDSTPVGTLKGPGGPGGSPGWFGGSFNRYLAGHAPNRLRSGRNAPDAALLYRQLLAAQPDNSVVVVNVGNLTNLRDLLTTGPDRASSLKGRQLVAQKVRLLSLMGGTYPVGPPQDPNMSADLQASQYVLRQWPTPIMFSGVELGKAVDTGASLSDTPAANPVRVAFEKWDQYFYPLLWDKSYKPGRIRPHSSYDQTSVLYAVRGLRNYFSTSEPGRNELQDDGTNRLTPVQNGRHRYLILKDRGAVAGTIESFMARPPAKK